ncbi:MAG: DUF459 domain-containing protein [Acidimicrobiia bacterium]
MSAGHVLVVMLVAFAVGTLLNARGMYRTAANQDEGWARTVGMGIMGPIRWVSVHTGLSAPRDWLLDVAGQEGHDTISAALPKPKATTTTATASTKPGETTASAAPTTTAARVAVSPERPLKMIIVGDSLVDTPGQQFLRLAADTKVVDVRHGVDGRVSTGLERPDFVVNWPAEIKRQTEQYQPDVVMIMLGANDDHSFMTGSCTGKPIGPFRSASWEAEYRCRVGGLMDQIVAEGRKVVWVGIPITKERADHFQYLNSIFRSEAEKRPGNVFFVDTYPLLQPHGKDGYADYLDIGGESVKVRTADGIHFEPAGGRIIARAVMDKVIRRHWDLDSWRAGGTTTTAPPTTAPPTTAPPTTAPSTTAPPSAAPMSTMAGATPRT